MSTSTTTYYRYDELTQVLKGLARQFPDLATLSSIGQTEQGREIWLMTVTDSKTGPHSEKPGFWVDGNTHASELAGCQASVHLIETLLTRSSETRIKKLLERVSFY